MAIIKILGDVSIDVDRLYNGILWNAKNGATRKDLSIIINEKDFPTGISGKDLKNGFIGRVGYLNKGNHSFIFINKDKYKDNKSKLAIYTNENYGANIEPKESVIFENSSIGGYGNSESYFAILKIKKEDVLITEYSYKHRRDPNYIKIYSENFNIDLNYDEYGDLFKNDINLID